MRMTEIAGALAAAQIERLGGMIENMRNRAAGIRHRLSDMPVDWRKMPDPNGDGGNVTMFFETEDTAIKFAEALRAEGFPGCLRRRPLMPIQPSSIAKPCTQGCLFTCAEHPTTRTYHGCVRAAKTFSAALSIGIGPRMTEADADDIVTAVRKVAEHLLRSAACDDRPLLRRL
jgi:8-amino-3,8-dideoxy-alpha-D-manno-octulosonate transaminase